VYEKENERRNIEHNIMKVIRVIERKKLMNKQ